MKCEDCGADHDAIGRIESVVSERLEQLLDGPPIRLEAIHTQLQDFLDAMVEQGEMEVGQVVEVFTDGDGNVDVTMNLGWAGEFVDYEELLEDCDGY